MNKGFTILELLAAILVISIGVISAYFVTQQMIFYTRSSSSRLTAAYLAKEGIEITRNTRDTNWLEGEDWDNELTSTDWQVCDISRYERRITITPDGSDKLKIIVEIKWQQRGETYNINVQENLYDWK